MNGSDERTTETMTALERWSRLQKWQQILALGGALVASVFTAGIVFQQARAAIVLVDDQKLVDARQDDEIGAVLDDNALLHISQDHLHEEVRGMRLDIRAFDPRIRGGGLPVLPAEPPEVRPWTTGTGF